MKLKIIRGFCLTVVAGLTLSLAGCHGALVFEHPIYANRCAPARAIVVARPVRTYHTVTVVRSAPYHGHGRAPAPQHRPHR